MLYSKPKSKRFISIAVTVVFLIVSMLASTESVNAATKLKVTAEKNKIYVGQTVKLTANKNVKWSVSKKKIAKLTKVKKKTVVVKGLKPGTVYVKAKKGKSTKKIKITVAKKPKEEAKKTINLTSSKGVIGIGEACTVTVTGDISSDDVTFSSSDSAVADVYSTGAVMGNSPGTATITATYNKDSGIKASVDITVVAAKAGVLTVSIDMTDGERYPAGKPLKAWFQVPVSDDNQTITDVKYEAKSAAREKIIKDSSGAQAYYIEWGPDVAPEDRVATLSFHIYRRAVAHGKDLRSMERGNVDTGNKEIAVWLRRTEYSGSLTSGVVKKKADEVTANAETVYDKAHAIYLWICDNITRNKTMPNRELGDVVAILSSKDKVAGSCIDINSIFVAMCNAEGIPARESFGYKIFEDPSKLGQNCRAEFFLPGYGWVEVDPAMPLAMAMNGTAKKGSDTWESIKETYWTTGSPDWICQNHGRDLTFDSPGEMNAAPGYMVNADGTLNHFMFPHGEYDGKYIPGYGNYASEFKYKYKFVEESPFDCGC